MQTIITYIIIGAAVGYTIYSIVKALSLTDTNLKCGTSCGSCPMKNIKKCSNNFTNTRSDEVKCTRCWDAP